MTARAPQAGTPFEVEIGRRSASWTDVKDWVALSGAKPQAVVLYQILRMHVNRKRGDLDVWPTTQTLALLLGLGRADKVARWIKVLVDLKAIDVRKVGLPARYRYTVHEEPPPGYEAPQDLGQWYLLNRDTVADRNGQANDKRARQRDAAKTRQLPAADAGVDAQVSLVAPETGRQAEEGLVAPETGRQAHRSSGVPSPRSGGAEPDVVEPDEENPGFARAAPDTLPSPADPQTGGESSEEERTKKDQPGGAPPSRADRMIAIAAEVCRVRSDWSSGQVAAVIDKALDRRPDRDLDVVRRMLLRLAADPATDLPARLLHVPERLWAESEPAVPRPRPDWCGECDKTTRLVGEDKPSRCPRCHPSVAALVSA